MKTLYSALLAGCMLIFLSLNCIAAPAISDIVGPYLISFTLTSSGDMDNLESHITQDSGADRVIIEFPISVPFIGNVNVKAPARYSEGNLTLLGKEMQITNSSMPGLSISLGHRSTPGATPEPTETITAVWQENGFTFDPADCLIMEYKLASINLVASELNMKRIEDEKPTCKYVGSLPGNGAVVESLSEIITYWHRIDERVVVVNRPMPLYNGNNVQVSTGRLENTSDTTCVITFDPVINTPGNYRIVIPEGTVTTRSGEALNSEATLHFTIVDKNFIPNIEALPDDYLLSFVMEPNGTMSDIATSIELTNNPDELIVNFPIVILGQQCNLAIPSVYKDGILTMTHNESDLISSPLGDLAIGFYRWVEGRSSTQYVEEISANWNGQGFSFNPDDCISVKSSSNPPVSYLFADYLTLTKANETIYKCSQVSFDYDGRYLDIVGNGLFDAIYYTFDSSSNPVNGTLFETPFDIGSINSSIRAVAVKDGYQPSEIATFTPNAYGIEGEAWVNEDETLQSAYLWLSREQQTKGWPTLKVHGWLDEKSYGFIDYLKDLRHLDLSDSYSKSIPEFGLMSTGIISISLPKGLESIGQNAFMNNKDLCAIIWNAETDVSSEMSAVFNDDLGGNGVLFYINGVNYTNDNNSINIIKDGICNNPILLNEDHPWYCPKDFQAKNISYVKRFSKKTAIDGCYGWETIALPFEVKNISFQTDLLYPFGNLEGNEMSKRFWLYRADNGWQPETEIKSYIPYLIAMPNNEAYYSPYNIEGDVTFSASDITIESSPSEKGEALNPELCFYPNFLNNASENGAMVVNDNYFEGNEPGSVFVMGLRSVKPFEAYMVGPGISKIPVMDSSLSTAEISSLQMRIWSENKSILICSPIKAEVPVLDLSGRCVSKMIALPNEVISIDGLSSGIYIVANKKVLVK
ncbi:MAG: chitobiase/beta-hexosaminidase C-terminal domain-containing protein [Muribaculaceae bacterium]|nr:chitobiase/beta-hexosaminidase C-terminal domain-containing protein [Muribaculaceae bacterium]